MLAASRNATHLQQLATPDREALWLGTNVSILAPLHGRQHRGLQHRWGACCVVWPRVKLESKQHVRAHTHLRRLRLRRSSRRSAGHAACTACNKVLASSSRGAHRSCKSQANRPPLIKSQATKIVGQRWCKSCIKSVQGLTRCTGAAAQASPAFLLRPTCVHIQTYLCKYRLAAGLEGSAGHNDSWVAWRAHYRPCPRSCRSWAVQTGQVRGCRIACSQG
jgi:hypothetical protein